MRRAWAGPRDRLVSAYRLAAYQGRASQKADFTFAPILQSDMFVAFDGASGMSKPRNQAAFKRGMPAAGT